MIAGAAAAQMVKEQMEREARFADPQSSAAGRTRAQAAAPARLRLRAAQALRAAADRLAPAGDEAWRRPAR